MKRPIVLIAGAVAALVVAAVGVSAHTGFPVKVVGVSHSQFSDEASGARLESPEPIESPKASPTAEPTEKPEASPEAEPTEKPESPTEDKSGETGATSGSGEHDGDHRGSGTGSGSGGGD
jgi:uncharacterized membrane protein YgcG